MNKIIQFDKVFFQDKILIEFIYFFELLHLTNMNNDFDENVQESNDNESIPALTPEDIEYVKTMYNIDISKLRILQYPSRRMIECIHNIKNFSCQYHNMIKQVNKNFFKYLHIFLYFAYDIIYSTPFILDVVCGLTSELIDKENALSAILYSLIIF